MKTCKFCGHQIIRGARQTKREFDKKQFCSLQCAARSRKYSSPKEWRESKKREARLDPTKPRGPRTPRECYRCGKTFRSAMPKSQNRICPKCSGNEGKTPTGGRRATLHRAKKAAWCLIVIISRILLDGVGG